MRRVRTVRVSRMRREERRSRSEIFRLLSGIQDSLRTRLGVEVERGIGLRGVVNAMNRVWGPKP